MLQSGDLLTAMTLQELRFVRNKITILKHIKLQLKYQPYCDDIKHEIHAINDEIISLVRKVEQLNNNRNGSNLIIIQDYLYFS